MKPQECCVLIPSLSPDERLPAYVKELLTADFGLILVVDDGSSAEYQKFFDEIAGWERCHVLHHEVNRGKGAALRTGFAYLKEHTRLRGMITADSDGQHTVPDTLKLAAELSDKEEILLGSRDFSKNNPNVPPKSRFGNRLTSGVFRVLYGQWLPDTQTGLRAFPRSLTNFMLSVSGDRFEYEMNMLIQASSIISFLVDYAVLSLMMFWVFKDEPDITLLGIPFSFKALVATPIARLCSAPVNFLLNKNFVFQTKNAPGAVGRYIILAVCSLAVTTLVFGFLDHFVHADFLHILLKIVIDVAMYVINYRIQKAWVFPAQRVKGES